MNWFREFVRRLVMLLRREHFARDLEAEIRLHRELRSAPFGGLMGQKDRRGRPSFEQAYPNTGHCLMSREALFLLSAC